MNKIIIALATVSTISTTAAIVLGSKLKKADEALVKRTEEYLDKLANERKDYATLENNYGNFINKLYRIDREVYKEVVDEMAKEKSSEETEVEA